ncbi:hypothetical protein [uncultured Nocardioides sp.]|uniref:hypothetical protein n=1 Tax=uncultured Nocardioides sp. TaxID=198441 RepID=UPI00261CE734|nr:hypothetical protein [uncultured Nocardioides sp.]
MDDTSAAPRPPAPAVPQRSESTLVGSWPYHLLTAAVTGVVTARMPVHRWSRPTRWALHGGTGALVAAGTAWMVRHPGQLGGKDQPTDQTDQQVEPAERPHPLGAATTTGLALAAGALVAGVSRGGQAADGWAEGWLLRRGVRRPRMWLGVAAAGASLGMSLVERRQDARSRGGRHDLDDPVPRG